MLIEEVYSLIVGQKDFFFNLTLEHLQLSLTAIILAIAIGLFLGIIVSEFQRNKWILSVVNFIYTIPSIALFGFLIPVVGIGNINATIALTIYALLPMVKGTYSGISNIDKNIVEAAHGMGSTKFQTLYKIKLPLALPHIMSGIRTMAVMTIALAGIAAFIGAGGLGVAIYRGITTNNMVMTIAGSLLIAILAIIIDFILGKVELLVQYDRPKSYVENRLKSIIFNKKTLVAIIILIVCIFAAGFIFPNSGEDNINIATKPMTEQYIIGYILKELIEQESNLKVELTNGVGGGTSNIHPGMLQGEFDLYPEYTGTGWMEVLKEEGIYHEDLFPQLQSKYNERYNLSWVGMFGFDNTYGIAVTKELAEKNNLTTYSDLAKVSNQLRFGAEYDFFERDDGYNALRDAYDFNFKSTTDLDIGLKYNALKENKIDVVNIFTTDGQLNDPNIVVLKDDKGFYPSYQCGNVVRNEILEKHPELREILLKLEGIISTEDMARMNYEVEVNKKDPKDVAHEFLKEKGLVN